jgi:hypothetical protein
VFEGGGYGVAVTAASVEPLPWPPEVLPPGVEAHPARLGEMMPVAARTDLELAAELHRVVQVEAALAAYKAELVTAFAALRPDTTDRRPGQPGAAALDPAAGELRPGISEFFADELALVLGCSRAGATTLAEVSGTLVERLPATWSALADGELDWPRARALAQELGWPARDTEPEVIAQVEAAVLPAAGGLSVSRLRTAVRRELLRRDAAAADRRREQAERTADVTVHPAPDGMAELRVFLPQPLAAATREAVDTYARMAAADGDPRPIGQLRAGVLADLVLRPWDTSRPPVTAHVTVVAPLGSLVPRSPDGGQAGGNRVEPGEVCGQPITAGQLRALLRKLDTLWSGGLQAPIAGSLDIALVEPGGALRATVPRAELERLARRGCLDHPREDCACALVDRPGPVDRYRPTPAQRRFVRTRDRTCRHPGCHSRAGWADLDHVVPHCRGGPTDCGNLCCLCRRHHRLKTHAPGWRFVMTSGGTLSVTTPSGITRTTRPPGLSPPPEPAELRVAAPGPADDPPPF